jgi:hypothetical protein|tara:strand:- start:865 stop:1758 length:894 start_codon:yes stop_codon:yes gene_type:complete
MIENNAPGVTQITATGANPLKKYFRQPKLYITLPSKGSWYPSGSIEMSENNELPVFPMTAKDELTLKTPDALLNGAATVEIIQSCIPNIKDAWLMPSIDVDACLIAIRIASYGEQMDLTITPPGTNEEKVFGLDLRQLLETMGQFNFVEDVPMKSKDFQVKVRPVTYKEFTAASLSTFEEQRMFTIVNDAEMQQEEKLEKFGQTFTKLRDLTVGIITDSIVSITVEDNVVTDRSHITDFISNSDKEVFKDITDHIEVQKENFAVKPMTVNSDPEQIANGAPETYEVPIVFDQASFFG